MKWLLDKTNDAILTGWVYLHRYVYPEKLYMKERTIILTAYGEELKKEVNQKDLKGITLIEKKRDEDEMNDVKEVLKKMVKRLGKRKDVRQ